MKISKLIINETIKTLKKTSTKVMLLLTILALLASFGLAKAVKALNDFSYSFYDSDWKEEMKKQITDMKYEIEKEAKHYDQETLANLKAQVETYELAIENDVNMMSYNGSFWKFDILVEIQEAKYNLEMNYGQKSDIEKSINDRIDLLKNDDYSGYMNKLKENEKVKLDEKIISKEEYEDNLYLLNLREKFEIYKENDNMTNWKEIVYSDIETIKQELRTGINMSSGKLLKAEEIKKLEETLKINEYRLENDIPVVESLSSERTTYDAIAPEFSMLMIAILMIIVSGSSISNEISKGTIKFLIFTPNKRWKILFAKIASAIILLVALTVITALISILIGNIAFNEPGMKYIYIHNGEVHVLSNLVYIVLYYLALGIDILVYMFFAFMLSTITRNTALSVALSIASYVGSGIVMQIINMYITKDWIKFIPFNNLGFADRIFTNNVTYSTMQMASGALNSVTLSFSFGVIGVCVLLMLVSMFDSFNKRDIM